MIIEQFVYGDFTCAYGLVRQERKTLSLTVYPDRQIVVKSPPSVDQKRIHQFLRRKYIWLNKQLRFFGRIKYAAVKKEYVSGESFFYLGRQYKLIIKPASESKVVLTKGKLWVFIAQGEAEASKGQKLLKAWYEQKANKALKTRFDAAVAIFKQASIKPHLKICLMKNRWGSCSKRGTITLNPKLIQVPSHCIEYVIMHELCHLVVHNHSPKYYKLLTRMMPDWQSARKRLESVVI